ncbi:MAG: polysaccharide deacetylase family protein [Rhodothermales bacterium]|nr:polysaccharide deacetylase family protein [Rhodothermales bacterium]
MTRTALIVVIVLAAACTSRSDPPLDVDAEGALVRGSTAEPEIALVFTGDEYADGATQIADVLGARDVKASFFLTGKFYRNPDFAPAIARLREEGHYLGAHSDQHLLYCDWEDRDSLLVTREEFEQDVRDNYAEMQRFGVTWDEAPYYLPPYEWYNRQIADWTDEIGLTLVNYTPGTRSHADYTTPDMGERYVSSDEIVRSILEYERTSRHGLNGFILLMHIGTAPERDDKLYMRLESLLEELATLGYEFNRIDEILSP